MNRTKVLKIIKLNRTFYKQIGPSFSASRKNYWDGWNRVMSPIHLSTNSTISVLDLGCGNGRFLGFLRKRFSDYKFKYTGYDTNEYLLEEATKKYESSDAVFKKKEILLGSKPLSRLQYDIVTCFGVMHHIPDKQLRKEFFTKLAKAVTPGGFLTLATWEFNPHKGVKSEYEEGSYLLSWDNNPEVKRFCHLYSAEEKELMVKIMAKNGLDLVHSFKDDVKKDNSNHYFIFRKLDTIEP